MYCTTGALASSRTNTNRQEQEGNRTCSHLAQMFVSTTSTRTLERRPNGNGVVQDMTSPSVVRWDSGNIYTKSPQFNCMATSGLLHDNLRSATWVCTVLMHTFQCAQAVLHVQYWFITLALCLRAMYASQFVGLAALQRACDLPGLGVKPQMASCMLILVKVVCYLLKSRQQQQSGGSHCIAISVCNDVHKFGLTL